MDEGGFLPGLIIGILFAGFLVYFCTPSEAFYKGYYIREKGFCIESKVSGVEFKKCYDLKERP